MDELCGKTAVITGCNRGIGKAILDEFVDLGADIITVTRRENQEFIEYCHKLSEEKNVSISHVYADFSNRDEIVTAAKMIIAKKIPIDILVNNVGIGNPECMLQMTNEETFRNVMEINFFSSVWLTQIISKNMMKNKKGSIVFISSSAAFDGGANVDYCASKAALLGMVKRLALELGNFGIRVNAVAPSLTETEMGNSMSEEDEKKALSMNIMHRKGKAFEIAKAVSFLASDDASFITAQTLHVDGGLR